MFARPKQKDILSAGYKKGDKIFYSQVLYFSRISCLKIFLMLNEPVWHSSSCSVLSLLSQWVFFKILLNL